MSIEPIMQATQRYLEERANVRRLEDFMVGRAEPHTASITLHQLPSERDSLIFTSPWEIQLVLACVRALHAHAAERMHAARAEIEALLK